LPNTTCGVRKYSGKVAMEFTANHALWWLGLGVALLAMEVLTTSFGFIFFGISALFVSVICWQFGLADVIWEMVVFAVMGGVSVPLFRSRVRALLNRSKNISIDTGKEMLLTAAVGPRAEATCEYQGAPWSVFNDSDLALQVGDRVTITRVDGIRLVIRPLHS